MYEAVTPDVAIQATGLEILQLCQLGQRNMLQQHIGYFVSLTMCNAVIVFVTPLSSIALV